MTELSSDKIRQIDKPALGDDISFPLFVEPSDADFDDDISKQEKEFYRTKHKDYESLINQRIHCTGCDRHLGLSVKAESRMRQHPMLRTLICNECHTFYNSGEFEKGDDGSELYCRWCGQGGQVYCCSDCPHVFCAKCIKRNMGVSKIKEIESTDDWKCFKCSPECLWNLRALCWAVMRFFDLRTKLIDKEEDPKLKASYNQLYSVDLSKCCKDKRKRHSVNTRKSEDNKDIKEADKIPAVLESLSRKPTIQVKKFASMAQEEKPKEKKPLKRPVSPINKIAHLSLPVSIAPFIPDDRTLQKRPKVNPHISYMRPIRPRLPTLAPAPAPAPLRALLMPNQPFNGYNVINNMFCSDNINLSLESLTQGLDMNSPVNTNDDIVCTPDFPLEPICEMTEQEEPQVVDDDDVQCVTPARAAAKTAKGPPPLVAPRPNNMLLDLSPGNIIQMTENDVNVNTVTGGLKFRVDPQTLSSNKMYRLPDGRIFAINANPAMPGGYSATIVAVTEKDKILANTHVTNKAVTYSAKLSAVKSTSTDRRIESRLTKPHKPRSRGRKTAAPVHTSSAQAATTPAPAAPSPGRRQCDLQVPVEWFRYNLIDAVDAIQYSLNRLNKMKRDLTTHHLRTRTVDEMRVLHNSLDRILLNSSSRFEEIKQSLNDGMKKYLSHKAGKPTSYSDNEDDDDDVEILNDETEPIFIDENSLDSVTETAGRHAEVQCMALNESGEKDVGSLICNEVTDDGSMNNVENDFDKDISLEKTKNENSCASLDGTNKTDEDTGPNKSTVKESSEVSKDASQEESKINNDVISHLKINDVRQYVAASEETHENDKNETSISDTNSPTKSEDKRHDKIHENTVQPMDTDDQANPQNDDFSEVANEGAIMDMDQGSRQDVDGCEAKESATDGLGSPAEAERAHEPGNEETSQQDAADTEASLLEPKAAAEDCLLDRDMSEDAIESLLQDDSDDDAAAA